MSETWTGERLPDLSGRTVVVTGANSGIGRAATAAFAEAGARVVMACRSTERGAEAKRDIAAHDPTGELAVRELDLADLDSVAAFAEAFERDEDRLDVLCNNAGVMAVPRAETAQGYELQFGVNHLGHFALTGHLLDALESTAGARVVTQSSGVHERGEIDFEDLQSERSYDRWAAYGQSQLANVLFAYELGRRYGDSLTSVACHPGYAATNLQRRGPERDGSKLRVWLMEAANALFGQSPENGALPMLYAATASTIEGGEYVGPGGVMNMRGAPEIQRSSDASYDRETARRLWERSAELTGVDYSSFT